MGHLSGDELKQLLESAKLQVRVGEKYFHNKNPNDYYIIIDLVIIEANEEVGVVYEALYESLKGVRFVRPINEFLSVVNEETGQKRFEIVK